MDGKSPFCTKEVKRGGKELERVGLLVRLFLYPYLCIVKRGRGGRLQQVHRTPRQALAIFLSTGEWATSQRRLPFAQKNKTMATKQIYFSATMQKSPLSVPARVMEELNLDRVVYFVLRGGTDEQREALQDLIGNAVIARIALSRARRQMIICRTSDDINDAVTIDSYRAALEHVFGEHCRITVRILWRGIR